MASTPETLEDIKKAPGVPGMLDAVLHRWSPRAYADREVSSADLKRIFDAARWAASSYNEQPWRFLVGRRGDQAYRNIFDALAPFNQAWAKSAPVLILSVAKRAFSHNGQPNSHAWHDTGAATATLALQATALGLHAHSMAGFDHDKARELFAIPAEYDPVAVTALGYAGDPAQLPEHLRKTEEAPRQRKDVKEIVFSEWDRPAAL
jgi:nitroreductase